MSERPEEAGLSSTAPRAGVRLQTRGVVQPGALYIARRVDEVLTATVRAGRWAVVLGPRFSGKSSLRVRTAQTLQATPELASVETDASATPYRCATIEARSLSAAGAGYLALCQTIASELRLPAVHTFWQRHSDEPPVDRFRRYLQHEVVTAQTRTVILIDDLDALQRLPLDLPELLVALAQVRDTLVAAGSARQLTLVCFSTVEPERLAAASPGPTLWAAERLFLPDFTRPQLAAFGPALAALVRDADPDFVQSWLDAVFDWTAGHPQLTQHLCQQLVARAPSSGGTAGAAGGEGNVDPGARVERLVRRLFLEQEDAIEQDPCLREMALALSSSTQASALVVLYRRLLSGVPVTPDALDAVQRELRLCGLATEADDQAGTPRLRPRCRLVATLLGEDWAREHEVRLILQEAIAHEAAMEPRAATEPRVATGKLLRGVPLKTAQAWARRHPHALRPPEVRVLLASLEAARSEAEARHQASAAALQRERRDKTELTYPRGPAGTPLLAADGRPFSERSWRLPLGAAIALVVCLVAAAWASAYRKAARFERVSQQASARALQAEQALQHLRLQLATKNPPLAPASSAGPAPPITATAQVAPVGASTPGMGPAPSINTTARIALVGAHAPGMGPAPSLDTTARVAPGSASAPSTGPAPSLAATARIESIGSPTLAMPSAAGITAASGIGTATVYAAGQAPTHAAIPLRAALPRQSTVPARSVGVQTVRASQSVRPKAPPAHDLPTRPKAARVMATCPDPDRSAH